MSFVESWYVSVIPIVIAGIMHFVNMNKMKDTYSTLKGVIRSRQDLHRVRDAINMSMTLAIVYLVMWVIMFVGGILLVVVGKLHFLTLTSHFFFFGIVTLPMGLIGKGFENRIKRMEVESDDNSIQKLYQDYLDQWGKPRLKIEERVIGN